MASHTLLIGGTKGLGRVVARQLSRRGDSISVFGRTEMSIDDQTTSLIDSYQVDITDSADVTSTVAALVAKRGPLNYCVFLQRYRGKDDDWVGEIQTTLTATKRIVEIIMPHMALDGDKALLMVSSVFAKYIGDSQPASYHVAKAGLEQLMRFYALNLGPKGIRCNVVTPFTYLKEESKKFYLDNKKIMDVYEGVIPLQRMASAEDSANAIQYLCSEQASFISGQNLVVDGGLSLVWPETVARRMAGI
jgi:NAD(P)-dependent dehydrogenase (short-subunit alcohol dehydrogenase family)